MPLTALTNFFSETRTVNSIPNFLEPDIVLELNKESQDTFIEGSPKQGYIGLVQLPPLSQKIEKVSVHLFPAFRTIDTSLRLNKDNKAFKCLPCEQKFDKTLHQDAAGRLNEPYSGLLGFSLWKSGVGISFQQQTFTNYYAPNQYVFIADNLHWKLYFVGNNPQELTEVALNSLPNELVDKIARLPTRLEPETIQQRIEIKKGLREWCEKKYNNHGETNGNVSHFLGKSRSQNGNAVKLTDSYREYIISLQETGLLQKDELDFLERDDLRTYFLGELPPAFYEKIFQAIRQELNVDFPEINSEAFSECILRDKYFIGYAAKEKRIDVIKEFFELYPEAYQHKIMCLMSAIYHGHADIVQEIINLDKDIIHRLHNSEILPLNFAIKHNKFELVKLLIENGADINLSDNIDSPLTIAIAKQDVNLISYLIKKGVDINRVDDQGNTPLVYAIEQQQFKVIDLLLENGVKLDVKSSKKSPLIAAIEIGNSDLVSTLIEKGIDINNPDSQGNHFLIYAIEQKQFNIAKLLIEKGAAVNQSYDNETPLFAAILSGNIDMVNYLLEHGANKDNISNDVGDKKNRYLIDAIENGNLAMADWLISKDFFDLSETDERGCNILHILAISYTRYKKPDEKEKIINLIFLLADKTDSNIFENTGVNQSSDNILYRRLSPLHIAINSNSTRLVSALSYCQGFDFNQKTGNGYTALHIATFNNDHDMVFHLLRMGAEINSQCKKESQFNKLLDWKTPLMLAVVRGHVDMVNLLLEEGADINLKDATGKTALFHVLYPDHHLIEMCGETKNKGAIVSKLLQRFKADVNIQDENGNTPLMYLIKKFISNKRNNPQDIAIIVELLYCNADLTLRNKSGETALSLLENTVIPNNLKGQIDMLIKVVEPLERKQLESQQKVTQKPPDRMISKFPGSKENRGDNNSQSPDSIPPKSDPPTFR